MTVNSCSMDQLVRLQRNIFEEFRGLYECSNMDDVELCDHLENLETFIKLYFKRTSDFEE